MAGVGRRGWVTADQAEGSLKSEVKQVSLRSDFGVGAESSCLRKLARGEREVGEGISGKLHARRTGTTQLPSVVLDRRRSAKRLDGVSSRLGAYLDADGQLKAGRTPRHCSTTVIHPEAFPARNQARSSHAPSLCPRSQEGFLRKPTQLLRRRTKRSTHNLNEVWDCETPPSVRALRGDFPDCETPPA